MTASKNLLQQLLACLNFPYIHVMYITLISTHVLLIWTLNISTFETTYQSLKSSIKSTIAQPLIWQSCKSQFYSCTSIKLMVGQAPVRWLCRDRIEYCITIRLTFVQPLNRWLYRLILNKVLRFLDAPLVPWYKIRQRFITNELFSMLLINLEFKYCFLLWH